MKAIIEKSVEPGSKSRPEPKSQFQSSFKTWIRIVAFIVVAVFLPEQAVQAKSRRDKTLDYFGMAAGGLLFATTPIAGQSVSTAVRNYAITYGVPKLLSKPLGEVGSQFVAGSLMGGFMNGRGGFNFKLAPLPMLQSGITWASASAIQEIGYKGKWDTKFGGITSFASNVGTNLMDFGLSKVLGGWKISDDRLKVEWLGRKDFKNYALEVRPFSFQNRWVPLISEGISLGVQHLAEKSFGWQRHPEYSRAIGGIGSGIYMSAIERDMGFKSLGRAVISSAAQGLVSAGLQHLTKEIAPLGPYMGAMMTLGLSNALYSSFSKTGDGSRLVLAKQLFKENARSAIGGFFSGGLATLSPEGNLAYLSPPDASFATNMVDFSRQARDLPNSSWTIDNWNRYLQKAKTPRTDFFSALSNRYFSNIHSQATNNLTKLISNRIWGVKNNRETAKDILTYDGMIDYPDPPVKPAPSLEGTFPEDLSDETVGPGAAVPGAQEDVKSDPQHPGFKYVTDEQGNIHWFNKDGSPYSVSFKAGQGDNDYYNVLKEDIKVDEQGHIQSINIGDVDYVLTNKGAVPLAEHQQQMAEYQKKLQQDYETIPESAGTASPPIDRTKAPSVEVPADRDTENAPPVVIIHTKNGYQIGLIDKKDNSYRYYSSPEFPETLRGLKEAKEYAEKMLLEAGLPRLIIPMIDENVAKKGISRFLSPEGQKVSNAAPTEPAGTSYTDYTIKKTEDAYIFRGKTYPKTDEGETQALGDAYETILREHPEYEEGSLPILPKMEDTIGVLPTMGSTRDSYKIIETATGYEVDNTIYPKTPGGLERAEEHLSEIRNRIVRGIPSLPPEGTDEPGVYPVVIMNTEDAYQVGIIDNGRDAYKYSERGVYRFDDEFEEDKTFAHTPEGLAEAKRTAEKILIEKQLLKAGIPRTIPIIQDNGSGVEEWFELPEVSNAAPTAAVGTVFPPIDRTPGDDALRLNVIEGEYDYQVWYRRFPKTTEGLAEARRYLDELRQEVIGDAGENLFKELQQGAKTTPQPVETFSPPLAWMEPPDKDDIMNDVNNIPAILPPKPEVRPVDASPVKAYGDMPEHEGGPVATAPVKAYVAPTEYPIMETEDAYLFRGRRYPKTPKGRTEAMRDAYETLVREHPEQKGVSGTVPIRIIKKDGSTDDNRSAKITIQYLLDIIRNQGWHVDDDTSEAAWSALRGPKDWLKTMPYYMDDESKTVYLRRGKFKYDQEELGLLAYETMQILQPERFSFGELNSFYDNLVGETKYKKSEDFFNTRLKIYTTDYRHPIISAIKKPFLSNKEKESEKGKAVHEIFAEIFYALVSRDETNGNRQEITKILKNEPEARNYLANYYIKLGFSRKAVEKLFLQNFPSATSPKNSPALTRDDINR